MDCITCEKSFNQGEQFCPECGGKLEESKPKCKNCAIVYYNNEKFCTKCGDALSTVYPLAEVQVQPVQTKSNSVKAPVKNNEVSTNELTTESHQTNGELMAIGGLLSGIASIFFYWLIVPPIAGLVFCFLAHDGKVKKNAWAMYVGLTLSCVYMFIVLVNFYACLFHTYCGSPFDFIDAYKALA